MSAPPRPPLLRGNYPLENAPTVPEKLPETTTEQFERAALRKLGGSMTFVRKAPLRWPEGKT